MFSQKTETEKADLLGERLVGGATEAATIMVEELSKHYNVAFRDSNAAPQFVIEVIVFLMHLIDRIAFSRLGFARREVFADRFIVAVVKEFLQEMSRELSADALGNALRDTYNRRQMQYARYKILVPEKDKPLKDTLYWEFSKILFALLDDANPAILMFLNVLVAETTKLMLDSLKVDEVL